MAPAVMAKIPIYIRNTFEPQHKGTRIFLSPDPKKDDKDKDKQEENLREKTVCGFTTVDNIALFNLEGTGMIGVPGIANRLFGALKNAQIAVMYIAQSSSEHSICFATTSQSVLKAKAAIEEAFFYELKQGYVSDITVIDHCSIIAAVGERMSHTPGVAGLFFGALGSASVSILSISQGCDERNISAVVHSKDATRALRAVHSAFWLSSLEMSVAVIGTGRVGSALLTTLLENLNLLSNRFDVKIKIVGIANSRKMILDDDLTTSLRGKMIKSFVESKNELGEYLRKSYSNISMSELTQSMFLADEEDDHHKNKNEKNNSDSKNSGEPLEFNASLFLEHLLASSSPHSMIIDTSTSHEIAACHPLWLRKGCHVVTANKRAIASELELYDAVFSAARSARRSYMSEVTIGAALPVFSTLQDLLYSGDGIHQIVGIMSVSAGAVLTQICDHGLSFSESVSRTFCKGLFEDDVFRDLEGIDVAEKLIVLGRELGIPMKIEDVEIEPLALRRPIDTFLDLSQSFPEEDRLFQEKAAAAARKHCTLRYIQRIECSPAVGLAHSFTGKVRATVKLEEVPLHSALAMVKGPLYHFAFHTDRYSQSPLVIQGPLSDSANTASGIFGDILRIARSLGAKDRSQGNFSRA
jgi:aspartokinase/homoserine dehydrogenase 1